jgi:hypothetical protein
MKKNKKLLDEYRFPGFRPLAVVRGEFGDNKARIVQLVRRQKKLFAGVAELRIAVSTIIKSKLPEICLAPTPGSMFHLNRVGLNV